MNRAFVYILLILLISTTYSFAQKDKEAKNILDKTSKIIKDNGDMEVEFTASSYIRSNPQGNMSGTIYLNGRKFNLVSTNIICWFNGKTLWTLNKANDEVNVSIPSTHERQTMDPYLFCDLYKKGYTYSIESTSLRGHDCNEIKMLATNKKQSIQEMIVTIDKKTNMPLCIRMREGTKYWVRISVQKCKIKQQYDNDKFEFNSKDYPTATVVDIR